MKQELIKEIRIDSAGRLCVKPVSEQFPYIYRTAMEVHWDESQNFLYSPKPREFSYGKWFVQIINAVRSEYGYNLCLSGETEWINVSAEIKEEIKNWVSNDKK